jgi:UDP-N-acetyl-D-mannosaminuronic acid dehydrogenase
MRFLPDSHDSPGLRVAVIGFGYIGSCLGVTLAERGMHVVAIDQDPATVAALRRGECRIPEPGLADAVARHTASARLRATTDYAAVADADVVLVTVGTPVDPDRGFLADQLIDACTSLARHLRRGQLVILKCTVPPATTRTLVAPLLEASGLVHEVDFGLAFCPERLAEGEALQQLVRLPVVVGGCGPASAAAACRFWEHALGVPVHEVPSAETAELVKLATNWWIDANIAIANELARYCATLKVDVLDVVSRANALPKGQSTINLLLPSVGVGGTCLTKDPWMAWRDARGRGVDLATVATARRVNDEMPQHTADVITDELIKMGRDPALATVAVLGVAFKNNTGDLRSTPVLGAVAALRASGARVRLFDPLADPAQVRREFGLPLAATLDEAVADADCIAVLAGHDEFRALDFAALRERVAMPCLVFDGRMYYPRETIHLLQQWGYGFRGVGR